ncbi:hypothetical protein PMZ80_008370 [Knufia obscura]|uniref:Transcription initiation factor TFIID subunit 10 n=2 Tax=Knufia TaxID=430999 RepID=A0AAN8EJZ2_9EURO|nr:hypothetical protein PMZ80_008370 [Knufia obscura]KAK5951255.1 hypothetical protein OHC33_007673 [Knufia fluminis]
MSSPPAPQNDPPRENTDHDIDAEMADAQDSTTQNNNPNPDQDPNTTAADPTQTSTQPQTQPSLPPQSRKDVTLREFLSKMDEYAPIIPDAVTSHYLTLAGLPPPSASDPSGERGLSTPLPLARLLALATQKFVADIAADAYQYSRIRASNSGSGGGGVQGLGLPGGPVPGQAGGTAGGQGGKGGTTGTALGVQRAGFGGGGQGGSAQGRTVLTMEDLGMAVGEYGVNVKRGEFYR